MAAGQTLGGGGAEERVFAADGGLWYWDIHARYFSDATGILDWYHVSEHDWEAAKVVAPDSHSAWANEAMTSMHDGGGAALAEWLQIAMATRDSPWNKFTPT